MGPPPKVPVAPIKSPILGGGPIMGETRAEGRGQIDGVFLGPQLG
jgi:hypothetical protein